MEALSPTMQEGQLIRWLKAEGDSVSNGDILAEIETDKAVMELVARGEGILRRVLVQEGATVPVGEVIGVIAGPDEEIDELVGLVQKSGSYPPAAAEPTLPLESPKPNEVRVQEIQEVAEEETPSSSVGGVRVKASPLARRMATEAAMDLQTLRGSGPGGRIVMRDVEAAKAENGVPSGAGGGGFMESSRGPGVDFEDRPLSQMRKTVAKRLVESLGPVPHFFLRITVDMSRTLVARKRVNELLEAQGEKVSINDFILKATANALAIHSEVNSQWMGDGIRRHFRVHLGVAVAVDDGLITPVIRDANKKGLAQIAREVQELAARGREKRLQPEEYTGSTFSVSNLGMFGIHEFTGVINPPEAAILAVGGIEETPVAEDGLVVVKPLMKVTMSCDHRVIDGATGAGFLKTLKQMLEEPAVVLV